MGPPRDQQTPSLPSHGIVLAQSPPRETPELSLEQVVVELDEAIDFDSMRDAWQHVLKTIEFFQKESDQDRPPTPLQQPSTGLANPTIVVETQENFDLENLLKSERDRVSDLNEPPLRRVALLRYNDQRWSMIWTILPPAIDQRFIAIVLEQVFDAYEKILAAQPPTQFQPASMKERMRREQLNNPERVKTIQPMLEGPKTPLPLPLRTKTGVPLPHRIAEIRQDSPRKLLSRLRQCASETGVNMEVLAQFAWGILLRRYGAGRDVSFGGVRSGPQFIDVDNSLAPFSVKLPVRIQLDPDVTVRHALQSLQADHLELAKHPWTPLQDIQRGLTGGVRLFETEVTYEQISPKAESPKLERWARRRYWSRSQSTCLLSLMAQENKGTLLLGLRYDAGLYDPQTASQILDDYLHILGAIAKQLDQPLRDLDALSPAMRNLLIDQQCAREETSPQTSMLMRVLAHCESQPHELAIHALEQSETLSYGDLGKRVRRLAGALRGAGVREGDIVAIHLPRGVEAIVSMLATHAAGAAFLPLDVSSPVDRRTYMLEDSQASLLLVDASNSLDTPVEQLRVDQSFDEIALDTLPDLPHSPTPPEGLAYVIYTSGSTGKPKGVCVEHGSLANLVEQLASQFGLSPSDRALQFTSLAFDASLEEICTTLATGASLWLRDEEVASSARAFFTRVAEHELNIITLPTAFWHQLVHSQITWPKCVRLVVVGGERVDPKMHSQFRRQIKKQASFINAYGPTEATVACTCYDDDQGDHDLNVLPIGRPLGGVSCFVLDENMVPVPPLVVGQLYLGGAGLARGYLRRDQLTAKHFVDHPFRPDARLYATGDLVRRTSKGNLVYIDRVDHQVKVQGYRVELGEIETCLRGYPGVEEAVVLPLSRSNDGGTKLIAFVQAPETEVDSKELRDFICHDLPVFMVPRQITVLRSLPQTSAGKIDRQALIARANKSSDADPLPSVSDPLQSQLMRIWSDILKTPVNDPASNFFLLGGDSLMAVRLFTEIERELGLQCRPQLFFEEPTIEALAGLIKEHDGTDFNAPLLNLSQGPANVRPLFLAPTVSGQVADYFHLAEALGGVAAIYGLQMRGLRSGETHHGNLRDAARFYVRRMREVQPQGPYSIIGFSAGGTVAIAIAEVLHEHGEQTDFLGMLDAVPPNIAIASPFTNARRMWRFSCSLIDRVQELLEGDNFFRNLVKRTGPSLLRLWARVWPTATEPVIEVVPLFERAGTSELTPEEAFRMQAHLNTTLAFRAQGYPIDVVLIRSQSFPLAGPYEDDLGWNQAVSGSVKIETVSVRHYDMVAKDALQPIAAIVTQYLNQRTPA